MHWSAGHSSVHVCTLGAPLGLRGTTVGARFSLSRVPRRVTHCLACNSAKAMDAHVPGPFLFSPTSLPTTYSIAHSIALPIPHATDHLEATHARGRRHYRYTYLRFIFATLLQTRTLDVTAILPSTGVHCAQCCAALPHQDRIIKPFLSQTSGCQQPLRACANANATTARLALDSLGLGLTWKGRLKEPQLGPLDTPAWLS